VRVGAPLSGLGKIIKPFAQGVALGWYEAAPLGRGIRGRGNVRDSLRRLLRVIDGASGPSVLAENARCGLSCGGGLQPLSRLRSEASAVADGYGGQVGARAGLGIYLMVTRGRPA
jgi:hypothetical protein